MNKFIEIIEKLKDISSKEYGNKKVFDKNIAEVLGINYDAFRKQKSRNIIPYFEIMQFLAKRNISINWFFFNQLPESLIEETSNYIILKYQRGVTASAGGGAINYEVNPVPLVVDRQLLEHINSSYKYTEVLQVFGESMEPYIKEGSLIFVDKSKKELNTKDIYLINSLEGLFIKKIDVDKDVITLKSINQSFHNITLHIDDVDVIGRVCGILIRM